MTWIGRSKGTVAGVIAGLLVLSPLHSAWAQAPKADRPTYAVETSGSARRRLRSHPDRRRPLRLRGRRGPRGPSHPRSRGGQDRPRRAGAARARATAGPDLAARGRPVGCVMAHAQRASTQFGQSVVRLTWKVDAYQDVRVAAGCVSSLPHRAGARAALSRRSPQSRRLELAFWYAPAIQQLVRRRQRSERARLPGRRPRPARAARWRSRSPTRRTRAAWPRSGSPSPVR